VDETGEPRRLQAAVEGVGGPHTQAYKILARAYAQIALGRMAFDEGGSSQAAYIDSYVSDPRMARNFSRGLRLARAVSNVGKGMLISGSHLTQMLSFRVMMERNIFDVFAALGMQLAPNMRKRLLLRINQDAKNIIEGEHRLIDESIREGDWEAMEEVAVLIRGYTDGSARLWEIMSGVKPLSSAEADLGGRIEQGAQAISATVGYGSGIIPLNNWLNSVAADTSLWVLTRYMKKLRNPKTSKKEIRAILEDMEITFGIKNPERIREKGYTYGEVMNAARVMRSRSNGVDVSNLERPLVMNHWLGRLAFSLMSVPMIIGSNMALYAESARTAGFGTVQGAMDSGQLKKLGVIAFGLMLTGLYREAQRTILDRKEPTDNVMTNMALSAASEAMYSAQIFEDIAYSLRFGGDASGELREFMFGNMSGSLGALRLTMDLGNIAHDLTDGTLEVDEDGISETLKRIGRTATIARMANDVLFTDTFEADNVKERFADKYERFINQTVESMEAMDDAMEDFGVILPYTERGKQVQLYHSLSPNQFSPQTQE